MFNATSLLGGLLQHIASPSARDRIGAALGRMAQGGAAGEASGGALGGLLGRFDGGAGGGVLGNVLGALRRGGRDPQADRDYVMGLARQAMASPRQEVANNNPLAVGGLGALVGTLLGGGRGAVGGGLLAVLGSLAVWALQDSRQAPAAAPDAPAAGASGGYGRPGAAVPQSDEEVERLSRLVLRAMIQAAKADGKIEPGEIERIMGRLDEGGSQEARDFVLAELRGPADAAGLAREVRSPVEAAEVYAAALMAIEVDSDAERDFLAQLARETGLRPETVAELHRAMGVA
jgi:uncharacterized membrane protein YebE (DUF533 family)